MIANMSPNLVSEDILSNDGGVFGLKIAIPVSGENITLTFF